MAVANREILAGSEKVWNQANFAEVQLQVEVRGIIGGPSRGIERGSRCVAGGGGCVGGFISRCCD